MNDGVTSLIATAEPPSEDAYDVGIDQAPDHRIAFTKSRLRPLAALLGLLAFRHVGHGNEVFDGLPCLIENRMADNMQVLHRPAGKHDPVIQRKFSLLAGCPCERLADPGAVFRVNEPGDIFFYSRDA